MNKWEDVDDSMQSTRKIFFLLLPLLISFQNSKSLIYKWVEKGKEGGA